MQDTDVMFSVNISSFFLKPYNILSSSHICLPEEFRCHGLECDVNTDSLLSVKCMVKMDSPHIHFLNSV